MIFAQFVLMLWLVMNVLSSDHEVKSFRSSALCGVQENTAGSCCAAR